MKIYFPLCLFVLTNSLLQAQVVLQPPGLEAGDAYRLIFTTSAKRDATSSDIEDYNNFVQSVANAAPVTGSWDLEWKAIGSTPLVDARDNTGTNPLVAGSGLPVYRIDGELWAENYEAIWGNIFEGVLCATVQRIPLAIDETGSPITETSLIGVDTGLFVRTGSRCNGQGTIVGSPSGLGDPNSEFGLAVRVNDAQLSVDIVDASLPLPMYAISEVLVAVPEPSSLFAVLLPLCAGLSRLRRRSTRFKRWLEQDMVRVMSAGILANLSPSCERSPGNTVADKVGLRRRSCQFLQRLVKRRGATDGRLIQHLHDCSS